jgi:hypothetical protein
MVDTSIAASVVVELPDTPTSARLLGTLSRSWKTVTTSYAGWARRTALSILRALG